MATTIPPVGEYTGEVPLIGQGEAEFSQNAQDSLQFQADLPPDINTTVTAINTVATEIEAESQTAQDAAAAAESNANFKGNWSDLTGALSVPASVRHNGDTWQLLVNLADVTASEPGVTSDWVSLQGVSKSYTAQGETQNSGLVIHPVSFSETAAIGDTVAANTNALRNASTDTIYLTSEVVSGEITELTFDVGDGTGTATIGGVDITLKEDVPLSSSNGILNYKQTDSTAFENMVAGDSDIGDHTSAGSDVYRRVAKSEPSVSDDFKLLKRFDAFKTSDDTTTSYPSASYRGDFSYLIPSSQLFRLERVGDGSFTFEYDTDAVVGTTNAVSVYVSSTGSGTGDGSLIDPITWARVQEKADAGDYDSAGIVKIYLMDDIYTKADAIVDFGTTFPTQKLLVQSVAPGGRSFLTAAEDITWTLVGSYYTATVAITVGQVCSRNEVDKNGVPVMYEPVDSVSEMETTFGSWYQDGTTLYVKPFGARTGADEGLLVINSTSYRFRLDGIQGRSIFKDLTWFTNGTALKPVDTDPIVLDRCHFFGGRNDAFYVDYPSLYYVILNECIAAWSGKDGFNYHFVGSDADDGVAVEINCTAYYSGKYKYPAGNTTTNSNNGSTSHDGTTIFRFGCSYYECEGMVCADINGCKSVNYGVDVGDLLETATGDQSGIWMSSLNEVTHSPSIAVCVDCTANGKNMENGFDITVDTFIHSNIDTEKLYSVTSSVIQEAI